MVFRLGAQIRTRSCENTCATHAKTAKPSPSLSQLKIVTLRLMDKILHRYLPAPTQVLGNNHLLRSPCAPPSPQHSMLTCDHRRRSSCARFWRDQGGLLGCRSLLFNIKHGVGIGRGWASLNISTTRKPVQDFVHQLFRKRHCFGFT